MILTLIRWVNYSRHQCLRRRHCLQWNHRWESCVQLVISTKKSLNFKLNSIFLNKRSVYHCTIHWICSVNRCHSTRLAIKRRNFSTKSNKKSFFASKNSNFFFLKKTDFNWPVDSLVTHPSQTRKCSSARTARLHRLAH